MTDFDRDPAALAWARAKVQREIDRARDFERQATAAGRDSSTWRKLANLLDMKFIGGEGCVIAAFDERTPDVMAALDRAESPA